MFHYVVCIGSYRESCEAIRTLLVHLQRLVKSMNSKQVLEGKEMDANATINNYVKCNLASEYAVSKTLHKLFKSDPDLASE